MKAAHLKPIKKKDIVGSNDSTSSRSSFVWNSIASGKKKTPGDRLEKHDMENDVYPVCYFLIFTTASQRKTVNNIHYK